MRFFVASPTVPDQEGPATILRSSYLLLAIDVGPLIFSSVGRAERFAGQAGKGTDNGM